MPVNISTVPAKKKATTTKSKKQEDAARVYKKNSDDPNAPQPPSPDSDATDNDVEMEETGTNMAAAAATATAAAAPAAGSSVEDTTTTPKATTTPSSKKKKKIDESYDRLEVNRLLSDLFPSNYMNEKLKSLESTSSAKPKNAKAAATTTSSDAIAEAIIENAFSEPATPPSSSALITTPPKAPKKPAAAATDSKRKQKQNFNIIIHVEPKGNQKDDNSSPDKSEISKRLDFGKKKDTTPIFEDNDDDSDEDYVPGDTDSSYDEDDEYLDEDEDYFEDDDESYYSSSSSESEDEENMDELEAKQTKCMEEMAMMQSLRATYEEMLAKDKTNRIIAKQLKTLKDSEEKIKKELEELTYRNKRKNSKKFRKLLRRKSSTNDLEYFKKNLSIKEQRALIDELSEVAKVTAIEKPYKLTLLESDIPRDMKAVALRKVGMLQYMEPGCGEYCKLKNWVDAFMQIPFNKHKNLPITIADGVDKCHDFMTAAKTRLDTAVHGLNDAKMQIMQMVGQWIANPAAIGTAVAIHGPPGTGKTSLVKEGISQILGRDFAFIALGGATDSSFLEGHSYTYEGSMWGKIVDILIRCKSSNPVIYFDELDKISETSKGEEIVGILTHLTDTSQNSQFHDKYFSEVGFDLSKCLFIFSYNDESRVNPVLLDRMYKIKTTGYSTKDKTFIAQHHLIPRIRAEVAFDEGDIVIPDAVVEYIVERHTMKESGVRNLKRCLETVYTKLNLHRLMRPGTQLFEEKEKSLEVSFPYTVSQEVVDKLIKKNDSDRPNMNLYL
jgi:ATP-dependent Lon protease